VRTKEAEVEIARVDALQGHYDEARDRLRRVLAAQPNYFDALSVLGYVEAELRDYTVAADLYKRALAVQESPSIRLALSKLPLK
jgi:tetratricopeptide (TPR) repeat protein